MAEYCILNYEAEQKLDPTTDEVTILCKEIDRKLILCALKKSENVPWQLAPEIDLTSTFGDLQRKRISKEEAVCILFESA